MSRVIVCFGTRMRVSIQNIFQCQRMQIYREKNINNSSHWTHPNSLYLILTAFKTSQLNPPMLIHLTLTHGSLFTGSADSTSINSTNSPFVIFLDVHLTDE